MYMHVITNMYTNGSIGMLYSAVWGYQQIYRHQDMLKKGGSGFAL